MNSDLNFCYEDFSSIIGTNSGFEKYQMIFYTFSRRWGAVELHIIRRFLLEGGLSALANLIPITDSQIVSIVILVSTVLGCYGIYKLVSLFEKSRRRQALLAPILTLFYYLNLWSVERIIHVWIWVAYAIFPMYLYFGLVYTLHRYSRYLVAYSLLFVLYGIMPHNFIYMLVIHMFLVILLFFLIDKNMKEVENLLLFIGGPIVIYSLINMPLLLLLMAGGLEYPIPMSVDQLAMLSRNGDLLNIFTFSNNWWPKVSTALLKNPIFQATSLLLFAFGFSALVLVKRVEKGRKILVLLSSMFVTGLIFFIQGTNNPILLNIIYFFGQLGYIDIFGPLREWGKLSILIPIFLVIMLTISLASLKDRRSLILTIFLLVLVILNIVSSPSLVYISEVYSPINVPLEYYSLNKEIRLDHKVLWVYPSSAENILGAWRYVWNKQKVISENLERSIGSTYNPNLEYVKMLSQKEAPQQLLNFLNIKYVIKRTDILGASNFKAEYSYLNCKKLDYLTVCENPNNPTIFYVPALLILSDLDGKSFYAISFPSTPHYVALVTEPRNDIARAAQTALPDFKSIWFYKMIKEKGFLLSPFRFTYFTNPWGFWSRASTADLLHAEWHSYLERFGVENWQSDYGEGLVFTWAVSRLKGIPTPGNDDLITEWCFDSTDDLYQWKNYNIETSFDIYHLTLDDDALRAELWSSTLGWKTINSPLIQVEYGNWYRWQLQIKGENTYKVQVRIVEYNQEKQILNTKEVKDIGSGTFNWQTITVDYLLENPETKYVQLQIRHGCETLQPLPSIIWIDNVKIYDMKRFIEPVALEIPFTIKENDEYVFLTRIFQNRQGGKIQIQLDNKNYTVNTRDQLNKFVWKEIDVIRLEKGSHKITLTNQQGFNAVNLFSLIPKQEYQSIQNQIENILQNMRIIHILEAETDLYHQNSAVSNEYGREASNRQVLRLDQTSKVHNIIEILKPGNYIFAIRSKGNLNIQIDQKEYKINTTWLNWTYIGPIYFDKGNHTIEITNPIQLQYKWNFNSENDLYQWKSYTPENQFGSLYYLGLDNGSLKAELWNSTWGWKTLNSPIIPVSPETTYQFDFHVTGKNVYDVQVRIVEYNSTKTPISARIMSNIGSGNFTWKNINFKYTPPQNVFYIQMQIQHDHEIKQQIPSILWIKNVTIYKYEPACLDVIWIYSANSSTLNITLDLFSIDKTSEVKNYSQINPTLWKVQINATKPFLLSFTESYDPLWEARVYKNGKLVEKVKSLPLYGIINGFWINTTGENLQIVIRYAPQDWFETGLIISSLTFIFSLFYLFYDWRRSKR